MSSSNMIQLSSTFDPSSVVFSKMKKNKNGVYVVDQRRHRAQQAASQLEALAAAASDSTTPVDPTTFVADVNRVREALAHI